MPKTTCFVIPDGSAYFFRASEYVRYDTSIGAIEAGYPKPIEGNWAGLAEAGFATDIDAAMVWPDDKIYFFKGDQYLRYDIAEFKADDGYPRPISDGWPGLFDRDINAAVVWPNGKAYVFQGSEYLRYDIATDTTDEGYPRSIAASWPGVFDANLDAAVIFPDGGAYFVRGEEYVRYDVAADTADEGYPRKLGDGFPLVFGGASAGNGLSDRRRDAVELVMSVVPSDDGDETFEEMSADWTGGGTTCGFLCHWLLWKLGCTDTTLVNRKDPASGLTYVDGKNISKLYHGGKVPFVKWTPGSSTTPRPGDIIFIRGDSNKTEHVFVFLSEETTTDGTFWNTAEAGQTNEAGRQCARLKRRKLLTTPSALRVSGNNPVRNVIGWVDLDLLSLS